MITLFTDESTHEFAGQPTVKEQIQEMTTYYQSTLQQSLFPNDSTSAWISVKDLQALIDANPGATGLRIYFGRHKRETIINYLDHKNFHNIIFVTTRHAVDSANPTMENSIDLLVAGANYLLFTNNGEDNVPTKPPGHTFTETTF